MLRPRSSGSSKATSDLSRASLRHAHEAAAWRKHLKAGQQPFATILACSDSRVPPELVFDQGFGELFVIRVAGNIVSHGRAGEPPVRDRHLHTPLIVVMGHESCGAVTAAVDALAGRGNGAAVHRRPRGRDRARAQGPSRQSRRAPNACTRRSRPTCAGRCASSRPLAERKLALRPKKTVLVGAVYDIATGKVLSVFLDRLNFQIE